MTPWINYHHLYYFKTIAEEGSVSKAAAKLRLGQPTLSAQLKQLESLLEVELFERRQKRLVLTEQGKIALDYAKNIFRLGSEMYDALRDRLVVSRPAVQIGAMDSVPKDVILHLTQACYKTSPCLISLSEGKPDLLLRELLTHQLDLVLTDFLPVELSRHGVKHRSLSRQKVRIYGAPKFKTLAKNFPESISGQPIILHTHESKLRQDIEHWRESESLQFDIVAESQDGAVKTMMAAAGIGLVAATPLSVKNFLQSGELVEIGQPKEVYEELFLLTGDRKVTNPIAAKIFHSYKI